MPIPAQALMSIGGDGVPPVVAVTSPTNSAYVTQTINLTATASDERGVASVQWQVDSVNVGAAQTVAPYTYALDTTGYGSGLHVITAVAKDVAGNHTTSPGITVNVANPSTGQQTLHTWNPIGAGSRREYDSVGSFASPNYTEGTGVPWPGNPYSAWGYKVQVKIGWAADSHGHGLESINGVSADHAVGLAIGSTQRGTTLTDATGGNATGWVDVPNTASGTAVLRDWLSDADGISGTAYTGDLTVYYRYQLV